MEKQTAHAANNGQAAFFSLVTHPVKLKLYLMVTIPAAFFSGVTVVSANAQACTASVPFRRFTQNPFRSTYFACLSMAAELSTGVLAMANVYKREPPVSMLITGMEAEFYKKATGRTWFTCRDGEKISKAIADCAESREGQTIRTYAAGTNKNGDMVAAFWFDWSFKTK